MSKGTVAIIGAGIGGIAVGRYLLSQGFSPTLFEVHDDLGGQWNRHNANSGVWPQLRTNTARFVTKLSDVQYPARVAMFPHNEDVLAMIRAVADQAGLAPRIRFGAAVTHLSANGGGGYSLAWTEGGRTHEEQFDRAVVATGRYNKPDIPPITGLDTFSGDCGVVHAFRYKQPERYRGKRVVICGGSISALEIASDLAMLGSEHVILSQRRQRYVMPKMVAGTPLEYLAFTREGGLALGTVAREVQLAEQKRFLLRYGGDPASYGAPVPHEDVDQAGVTGSQHYLNLVAENRIDVRPWIDSVAGKRLTFADGSVAEADGIVVGTGFDLSLPFLDEAIARTVRLSRTGLALADFTFHPDLPGLAFLGLWAQLGPYPVVLEQQARYIAYAWGGAVAAPSTDDLRRGLAACLSEDHHGGYRQQHEMALRFARLAGTDPGAGATDPEFGEILAKSAVTGEMFRITGPDARPDAEARVRADFWRYAPPEIRAEVMTRYGRAVEPVARGSGLAVTSRHE